MHHPFENNTPHIKLWGVTFQNYPPYFGQPENDDQHVLSRYTSSCVSFIRSFGSITLFFWHTDIGHVIRE
jgi:hypothetical protein